MLFISGLQIEASWAGLPQQEQERIFEQLQEAQKKDWKELSLDEKKACKYWRIYVARLLHWAG